MLRIMDFSKEFTNIFDNTMYPFIQHFKKIINKKEPEIIQRKRKLTFKDIIYAMCLNNGAGLSYSSIVCDAAEESKFHVNEASLIEKKNNISYTCFNNIVSGLTNFAYKTKSINEFVVIACDGTVIYLPKKFNKNKINMSNNGHCSKLGISGAIDVNTKIPLNYKLNFNSHEREALKKQLVELIKIHPKILLIMDAGYFENDLLIIFKDLGIEAIFRMPETDSILKQFATENDVMITKNLGSIGNPINIPFRLVQYKLNGSKGETNYILGTTLVNQTLFTIDFLKKTYRQRWKVETHFKHIKCDLTATNITSTSMNGVRQDIIIHQLIMLISAFIESSFKSLVKPKYLINFSNCIRLVVVKIIPVILYNNIAASKIIKKLKRTLRSIIKTTTMIVDGRNYKRVSNKPRPKFDSGGNSSNRINIKTLNKGPMTEKKQNKINNHILEEEMRAKQLTKIKNLEKAREGKQQKANDKRKNENKARRDENKKIKKEGKIKQKKINKATKMANNAINDVIHKTTNKVVTVTATGIS